MAPRSMTAKWSPELACEVEILLDQHDRNLSQIAQIGDGAADILDDRGLNSLGRLIQQQQPRPHDQRAADGELLLLAAGQITAAAAQHAVEHGKQGEHVVGDVTGPPARAGQSRSSRFSSTVSKGKISRPCGT